MNTKRLTTMAMLAAISMIVFVIESQIPIPVPIPGIKLGIANVITLFAIWTVGRRDAAIILLVRIVMGNLVIGQVMAMLYSLSGGIVCLLVMCAAKQFLNQNKIWLMSMLGAVGHNAGQLTVAVLVMGTPAILWYAPALLAAGLITGFFTGKCAQAVLTHMAKLNRNGGAA